MNISLNVDRQRYGGRPLPLAGYRGKPCTVWIGKISPSVTESTMRAILEQCGTIISMKSYIDTTKGFCLVTFSAPEGVYLAKNLLQGLALDGQALLVHLNRSTSLLLSSLMAEKSRSNDLIVSQALEVKARENIHAILRQRLSAGGEIAEANAAAIDFLASLSTAPENPKDIEVSQPTRKSQNLVVHSSSLEHLWREALRTLQKNERERLKRYELETDKLKDLTQERHRQVVADSEIFDPRECQPIHLRKPYHTSRDCIERRKRKDREVQDDVLEEQQSNNEQEAKQPFRHNKLLSSTSKETNLKKYVNFDEDDIEIEQKKLVPIQYSKEEMVPGRSKSSKQAIKTSIMAKIPKSIHELEKYKVKWEYFDVAGKSVHNKILGWIGKKISEMMGENESSFCDFIFQELMSHRSPHELIQNLSEVLDEDTENFVIKLFGVVIYETERIMNGG